MLRLCCPHFRDAAMHSPHCHRAVVGGGGVSCLLLSSPASPSSLLHHRAALFYTLRLSSSAAPSSTATTRVQAGPAFRAPPNVGPGRRAGEEANPFKSWEHLSHQWLILMCVGCLCAGLLAGNFVEVDESKLKPKLTKEEVVAAACKQFEFRPDLAATSIRVAFVLAARRAGFPAETVDESCAVVAGLGDFAGVMNYLSNTFSGSTEDVASLAAIAAVKYLNGPYDDILRSWRWGRNDSDAAPSRNVPADAAQKVFSIPTILKSLGGLTDAECVALMACHSVGEYHEDVSGVEGVTHTGKRYTLGNSYFQFLLAQEKHFSAMTVERTQDNKEVVALPQTLMAVDVTQKTSSGASKRRRCAFNKAELDCMLKNRTWRELVICYATDEEAWRAQFQSAFSKMIDSNFKRLRVYSDPKEA